MQPIYIAISVIGALLFGACCYGWESMFRRLRWQLPFVVLVCLVNPLISRSGITVLCTIGPIRIKLESLIYGLCMGGTLVAMLQWISNASAVLTQDKTLSLAGKRLPVVSTMLSMAAQLVPQLAARSRTVTAVLDACSAARGDAGGAVEGVTEGAAGGCAGDIAEGDDFASKKRKSANNERKKSLKRSRIKASTVLMSWAMEDSLERADAMRARGWGATQKRTRYRIQQLVSRDMLAAVGIFALIAINGLLAAIALKEWTFYPFLSELHLWWGYIPYIILVTIPTVATLVERLCWRIL